MTIPADSFPAESAGSAMSIDHKIAPVAKRRGAATVDRGALETLVTYWGARMAATNPVLNDDLAGPYFELADISPFYDREDVPDLATVFDYSLRLGVAIAAAILSDPTGSPIPAIREACGEAAERFRDLRDTMDADRALAARKGT